MTTWVLHLAFVVAPPFVILLSLLSLSRWPDGMHAIVPSCDETRTNRRLRVLLQSVLVLSASVMFLFSSFDLCMGSDLFGTGSPVLVTATLAIGGALSTLLFALKPMEMHRRTVTVILVALTLAMRMARALAISDVMLEMDAGGWTATAFIALGPPAAVLVVAMAFPPRRATAMIVQESLLPTERGGS